jgi:hypothetical protein
MMSFARVPLIAAAGLAAACGQKGPPLAPLHLVPAAPAGISVSRAGQQAQLRFVLPAENMNGPGPSVLDRIEIYAITVAPGAAPPANRELMTSKFVVGTIPVKPARVEGTDTPAEGAAPDTRPSPGDKSTFVEALTEEKVKPVTLVVKDDPTGTARAVELVATAAGRAKVPAPVLASAAQAGPAAAVAAVLATAGAAAATAVPPYPVRIYVIRGLTKGGRPGQPTARVELPVVDPPPAPPAPTTTVAENGIGLVWTGPAVPSPALVPELPVFSGLPADPGLHPVPGLPVPAAAVAPSRAFNVYKSDAPDPLNGEPIAGTQYERAGVSFGAEECFVIRAVEKVAGVVIESDPSPPACVTPRDTFPPAAPKGLSVVAGPGTMNLSWDANNDADLAGYQVLRGEAPGETLQPLTPAPIAGTSFEDKTVKADVRYVYAIVAVDKATPPNRSAPSPRVEETAR